MGYHVAIIALFPLAVLWQGYGLSVLNLWFLVPLGGPAVSALQAAGVSLILTALFASEIKRYQLEQMNKDRTPIECFGSFVSAHFFGPLVFLGFGWVLKQFV